MALVTRGHVRVDDDAVAVNIGANYDPATLRRIRRQRMAMVVQQFGLLPWRTVRDNIGFGREARGDPPEQRRGTIDQPLELVGLSQWGNRYCSVSPAACSSASAWRGRSLPKLTSR